MVKSTEASHIPRDRLAQYDRVINTQPGVERKGASIPYTSVNGHMFSFLSDAGTLVLRLPADERAAFLERHNTTLHEAHGTVMKEYVTVPDRVFTEPMAIDPYFALSYAYVAALKPKPTRRKP